MGILERLADHDVKNKGFEAVSIVNKTFQESSPSFWITRSQRSRRRDKGLLERVERLPVSTAME